MRYAARHHPERVLRMLRLVVTERSLDQCAARSCRATDQQIIQNQTVGPGSVWGHLALLLNVLPRRQAAGVCQSSGPGGGEPPARRVVRVRLIGAEPTRLEQLEAAVRAAAQEVAAEIVPAVLHVQSQPTAAIEAVQLVALIRHLRPRLVYMLPVEFEAKEFALEHLEGEGDEDWLMSLPEVGGLIRRWRRHDGQAVALSVAVVADGVVLVTTEDMPWGERFVDEVDALLPAIALARDGAAVEERARLKRRIAGKVADLIADHRFTAGRAGHGKRLVLARSLFAGLSDDELEELVTEAENAYWLKTGRS